MRYKYRVSKYDPRYRDAAGFYQKEEWTFFAQVGTSVGGRVLTSQEYRRVEKNYLDTIREMLREADIERVQIARFRAVGRPPALLKALQRTQWVDVSTAIRLSSLALREKADIDFRIPRRMYLHFGSDLYVYLGLPVPVPHAIAKAYQRGIYVEEMPSPYRAVRRAS